MKAQKMEIFPAVYSAADIQPDFIVVEFMSEETWNYMDSPPDWWSTVYVFEDIIALATTFLLSIGRWIEEEWLDIGEFLSNLIPVKDSNDVDEDLDQQFETWRELFSSDMGGLQTEWNETGIFPAYKVREKIDVLGGEHYLGRVALVKDYVEKTMSKATLLLALIASNPENADYLRIDPVVDSKMIAAAINGLNSSLWENTWEWFDEVLRW